MSVNSKMTTIADAIRNLLDISGTMGLDAMANNISSITKRGAVAGTISTKSEQYIIPAGYHNGNGTVGIADAEQAKIIAENIKNGVTILGVSGTASGDIYAIIAVTYPEGSICTCSDGTTTLTARDTSGKALFNVTVGEWTVTATDGNKTVSDTVSITIEGQIESVSLSYVYYLFKAGSGAVVPLKSYKETNATISVGSSAITVNYSDNTSFYCAALRTESKIDLGPYSTLKMSCTPSKVLNQDYNCIGVTSTAFTNASIEESIFSAKTNIAQSSSQKTASVDISKLTSSLYVGFLFGGKMTVTDIWLE